MSVGCGWLRAFGSAYHVGVDGFEADLIGGPCSGQRLRIAAEMDSQWARWRQVLPPSRGSIAEYWLVEGSAELDAAPIMRFAEYRRIGVRDDGRRVFAFHASGSVL